MQEMISLLEKLGQSHILTSCKENTKKLENQLLSFDQNALFQQKEDLLKKHPLPSSFVPLMTCKEATKNEIKLGKNELKKGSLACIVLAGGQASRLSSNLPKGCIPLTLFKKKSLFQIFSEKILHAEKLYNIKIFLFIMLSSLEDVKKFFSSNNYFGLNPDQIIFFSQNRLPILDEDFHYLIDSNGLLLTAPDGNGELFFHLFHQNFFSLFEKEKIQYLSIFSIDNPLIDPINPSLLGRHINEENDVTMLAVERLQNSGLIIELPSKSLAVLEYFYATSLSTVGFSNANHFMVNIDFAKKMGQERPLLFYHLAKKTLGDKKLIYKSEKFLFDTFIFSKKVGALFDHKKNCFAPLKKLEDFANVQKAMLRRDLFVYNSLTLKNFKEQIELSQEFYYPTRDLIKLCKKENIPSQGYIKKSDLEVT